MPYSYTPLPSKDDLARASGAEHAASAYLKMIEGSQALGDNTSRDKLTRLAVVAEAEEKGLVATQDNKSFVEGQRLVTSLVKELTKNVDFEAFMLPQDIAKRGQENVLSKVVEELQVMRDSGAAVIDSATHAGKNGAIVSPSNGGVSASGEAIQRK